MQTRNAQFARRLLAIAALVLCAPLVAANGDGKRLTVCLLAQNSPYSERATEDGFDLAVARQVAKTLGRTLAVSWSENSRVITELDDSDLPLAKLGRGACDAIFSVPGPAQQTLKGQPKLALGKPYYGAAFELVRCANDAPAALGQLTGKTVAIQSQTIAHFALLALKAEPQTHFSPADALASVAAGKAHAGLLWGPAAGWLMQAKPDRTASVGQCQFAPIAEPLQALRWNLHVATRADERQLRQQIDDALAKLASAGALKQLKGQFGLPNHGPFNTVHNRDAMRQLAPSTPP